MSDFWVKLLNLHISPSREETDIRLYYSIQLYFSEAMQCPQVHHRFPHCICRAHSRWVSDLITIDYLVEPFENSA